MNKRASVARTGRPPSQRQLRVGEEIRHSLAKILLREDFLDPDLMGQSITVTEVKISPDMRNATVFVTPLAGDAKIIILALRRASNQLRRQLSSDTRLRHTPNLKFEYDDSFDQAERISLILNKSRPINRRQEDGDNNGA